MAGCYSQPPLPSAWHQNGTNLCTIALPTHTPQACRDRVLRVQWSCRRGCGLLLCGAEPGVPSGRRRLQLCHGALPAGMTLHNYWVAAARLAVLVCATNRQQSGMHINLPRCRGGTAATTASLLQPALVSRPRLASLQHSLPWAGCCWSMCWAWPPWRVASAANWRACATSIPSSL